jgi:hypothetical protein
VGHSIHRLGWRVDLANQWHRPSDVIAALLVVGFWGCVAGAVLAALGSSRPGRMSAVRRSPRARRWWLVVPFLLVTAVSFVITFMGATEAGSSSTLIAYVGGAAAIIASGFVLALVATRVFARLP